MPISGFSLLRSFPCTEAPLLPRHYPASSLQRASPPPATTQPVPRGPLVGALRSCCGGFPVLSQNSSAYMPSPLPRRTRAVLSSLASRSISTFPMFQLGRRSHPRLFEAYSVFIHITACGLADLLRDLYHQRLQPRSLPSASAPAATGGAKVAGWVLLTSPLKSCASTAHCNCDAIAASGAGLWLNEAAARGGRFHCYVSSIHSLAKFYHRSPEPLSSEELEHWLYHLIAERKQAPSTVNLAINAVRSFYGKMLQRDIESILRQVKRP